MHGKYNITSEKQHNSVLEDSWFSSGEFGDFILLFWPYVLLLLSVGLPVANAPDVLQPCGLLYYL
jgi:hypothetical protein